MPSDTRVHFAIDRLRSTYWFLPSTMTVIAVALGVIATAVDRTYPDSTAWLGWAYSGGTAGARALLSAVAGSMITVVSVTFSVLVVALTVSSQHFGPRLLRSFMRDQPAQVALGMFTGTFAYCLIVLRTVRGEGDSYSMFVPHLAVTGAMILALASVGVLIYYVHHVATSMQLSEIAARIAAELDEAIDKLYPERIGEEADQPPERRPAIPEHAMQVTARDSGYIQRIDGEEILGATSDHDVMIWLLVRPGDFVVARDPIAAVFPVPREASACADQVVNACALGSDRTVQQDVAFGVQQLVEVALRALSPGTNEPFTAITAIDRLGQALSKVACRKIPSATRMDGGGRARVVTRPRTLEKLLQEAFEPIVLYAGRNPAIAVRMLQRLERLARLVRRDQDRVAVDRMADTVCKIGSRQIEDERHRNLLAELRNAVHVALSSSTENRDRAKAS